MKWSRFWQRTRRDADLRQELDAYLEQETADRIAAGMSPDEARWAATRKLGNVTRIHEDLYEQNSIATIETLWRDFLYGLRLLRRNPGFTVVAVMSVALGIGANASVFTLLDQMMLRPLPVERPQELVLVTTDGFQYGDAWGEGDELSYPMFTDLRDHTLVFSGMFGRVASSVDVTVRGSSERLRQEVVSGTYFPVLGVVPAAGRVLDAKDEVTPGGHPVVVLSHRYWRDRWRSDPSMVGESIRVNNHPMTIVGVARDGFDGTNLGAATELFVPIMMAPQVTQVGDRLNDRRMRWVNVFGRLKPGTSAAEAKAGLRPFYLSRLQFESETEAFGRASARDKARFLDGGLVVAPAAYGKSRLRAQLTTPLWTLTVIGAGVLIIACANVANLLLSRATARRREMAVRLALGATRQRVIRQLLVESVLLALMGGAAGLALATWGAQGLLAFFAEPDTTLTISAWPDARVLAINFVMAVGVGILFGLAPAWHGARPDVGGALREESRGVVVGGMARVRQGLVVAQVALSLLLLVGSGVFLRSLQNLLAVDTGFDTSRLLTFSVSPGSIGYDGPQSKLFARTVLERVRATPGVAAAGYLSNRLLEGGSWNSNMTIEGRSDPDRVLTYNNLISPGWFDAMGMRIVAGRDFDSRDERHVDTSKPMPPPRSAIVNEEFVRRFLGSRNPIGVHLGFGRDPGTPTPIEIVGVVTTAKYTSLRAEPQPQLYFSFQEGPSVRGLFMYVRTMQPPASLAESMRQVVRQLDAAMPFRDVRTVEEQVDRSLANERFLASLSAVLGVLATLLAMVGLYGVMTYAVARRTREIAVRVAFGAASSRVTSLIVGDVVKLVALGIALALPALWWLQRFVSSQLYGVSPTDASSILSAAGLLLLAATVAVWVPCRRALRIDPMMALRDE